MGKNKKPRRNCLYCGKICHRPEKFYCDNSCQGNYQTNEKIKLGKAGWRATKTWMIRNQGYICKICKITEWMEKQVPLIMDHIDGDHSNNNLENLRLICGNCDMQLPTYKKKNIGKGRAYRRDRYAKGLSY